MLFIVGVFISYIKLIVLGIVTEIVAGVEGFVGKRKDSQVLPQYQSNNHYMKINVMALDQMKQDLTSVLKGNHAKAPNINKSRKNQNLNKAKAAQPSKIQWILPFCEMKLGDYRLINKKFETEQNTQVLTRIEAVTAKFSKLNLMQYRTANLARRKLWRFVSTRLTIIYEDQEYR